MFLQNMQPSDLRSIEDRGKLGANVADVGDYGELCPVVNGCDACVMATLGDRIAPFMAGLA
jgi:hypothetical protein